ncbi:MAG TPA: NAD(P)-dependent oxidoreductase [Vicinamibacterales bacterium]
MIAERVPSVAALEELLSEPTPAAVESVRRGTGDLIVLGAGGKMGPTLARMARRAIDQAGVDRAVIAVSRFSDPEARAGLERHGIRTVSCDLLDQEAVALLPDAADVVYMAGMKFGASADPSLTWAQNCLLPAAVCRRYAGSRIAAFSTGNIYGLVPAGRGGSRESDEPGPVGEYAMSCLGRERVFQFFSTRAGTPVVLLRLNYACELRYGVLVDIARRVFAGEPIDLTMGYLNAIWQGDANAMALCALDHAASPARILNIAGLQELRVRGLAEAFGRRFGRPPVFTGTEAPDALLSNGHDTARLLGAPRVAVERMIDWIADWVMSGGPALGKPTRFEVRDGRF